MKNPNLKLLNLLLFSCLLSIVTSDKVTLWPGWENVDECKPGTDYKNIYAGYLDVDKGYDKGIPGPVTPDMPSKSLYYIFVESLVADAKILVFTGSGYGCSMMSTFLMSQAPCITDSTDGLGYKKNPYPLSKYFNLFFIEDQPLVGFSQQNFVPLNNESKPQSVDDNLLPQLIKYAMEAAANSTELKPFFGATAKNKIIFVGQGYGALLSFEAYHELIKTEEDNYAGYIAISPVLENLIVQETTFLLQAAGQFQLLSPELKKKIAVCSEGEGSWKYPSCIWAIEKAGRVLETANIFNVNQECESDKGVKHYDYLIPQAPWYRYNIKTSGKNPLRCQNLKRVEQVLTNTTIRKQIMANESLIVQSVCNNVYQHSYGSLNDTAVWEFFTTVLKQSNIFIISGDNDLATSQAWIESNINKIPLDYDGKQTDQNIGTGTVATLQKYKKYEDTDIGSLKRYTVKGAGHHLLIENQESVNQLLYSIVNTL